jgi:signal transduction histidine kinase
MRNTIMQHFLNQVIRRFARFPFAARQIVRPDCRILSRLAALAGLMLTLGTTPDLFGQTTGVLTNLAQVNALPLTKATNGIPVKVRVTITYMDPDWRMMFVQDDTGSIYVKRNAPSGDASWNLPPGEVVDLEGTPSEGIIQCNIAERKLHPVGQGPLPKPWLLDSEESFKNVADARWVRATGVITGVRTLEKKLDLDLQVSLNRNLRLIVAQGNPVSAATLIGCMASVTGVYGMDLDANSKPTGRNEIWVNDLAEVQKTYVLPITPISNLTLPVTKHLPAQMSRVQGNVVSQRSGKFLTIRDDSGSVQVNCSVTNLVQVGSPVEVFGYVASQDGALVLNNAMVITPNLQNFGATPTAPLAADKSLPELRQIAQIRNLPANEAARGYPVNIRGVLTYADPDSFDLFIQDSSGGIFVAVNREKFESIPAALQLVEITGYTGPGDYAPVIEAEQLRVLGEAALPNPKSATIPVLMTGAEDSQWISLNGVVRSQTVLDDTTTLSLATGDSTVTVLVPDTIKHPAPRNFVDAWVEVRGVCATVFDNHRHLQAIRLDVPNWDEVRTWSVGAEDPFALAVRPVNQLLEFHAGDEGFHRAHVRGTVLLCRTDGSFYLQDATGGILVQAQATPGLIKTGQILDVAGFPSIVNKWPVLQEAIVRVAAEKSTLTPAFVPPESLLSQTLYGTLIRLQARVIGHVTGATEESLNLQSGPWIADAILEKNQPIDKLAGIAPGSTVELTGVYLAQLDENLKVQSFQLLLRSPDDVRVLARPSWWTVRRVIWSVAALGMALASVLAWVTLLHRQVNARTRELRAEIEERKRMEAQVTATHKELLIASRGAGMAEVASNVLHNVGNVLNSVNVSATLVVDSVKKSKAANLAKVVALMRENGRDLPAFIANDPRGKKLPDYLAQLSEHMLAEQGMTIKELALLRSNIEHIKEIVAMQQSYAKVSGVREVVNLVDLVEDSLQINAGSFQRHGVEVIREFEPVPPTSVEKHKILQILVNLVRNAKDACDESGRTDKRLTLRVAGDNGSVKISVGDNGVGILPENLTRIFNHGFTTRKDGHGFGLHSGALAAKEMGGSLTVHSDGPGQGATFTLDLPCTTNESSNE